MAILRICYSILQGVDLKHSSMTALRFSLNEHFVLPNVTQVRMVRESGECLRLISTNETDVMPFWTPLHKYAPHLRFFTITDQSSSIIISSYDPVQSTSLTDVLTSFSAYTIPVVMLTIISVLLAYLFFRTYSSIYRDHKRRRAIHFHGQAWVFNSKERKRTLLCRPLDIDAVVAVQQQQ